MSRKLRETLFFHAQKKNRVFMKYLIISFVWTTFLTETCVFRMSFVNVQRFVQFDSNAKPGGIRADELCRSVAGIIGIFARTFTIVFDRQIDKHLRKDNKKKKKCKHDNNGELLIIFYFTFWLFFDCLFVFFYFFKHPWSF